MTCRNCPKPEMFLLGEGEKEFPLCLDCYIKYEDIQLRQQEAYERQINFLSDEMDSMVGLQPSGPRYPDRRPIIHTGGVVLNNINVSNSAVGVLNTGNVENLDSTLTVLRSFNDASLASSIQNLTEQVIQSDDLTNNQKNEILELITAASQEAVAEPEQRKKSVVVAVLSRLTELLAGVSGLATAFSAARSAIEALLDNEA